MADNYVNIEFYDKQNAYESYDIISLDTSGWSKVKFELFINDSYEEWVAILPVSYSGKIFVLESEGVVVILSTRDFCVFNYLKKEVVCYFNEDFRMCSSIFCKHRREVLVVGYTAIRVYNIDNGGVIWEGEFDSTTRRIIDGLELDSVNNNILYARIFLPADGGYYPFQLNLDSKELTFEDKHFNDIELKLGKLESLK